MKKIIFIIITFLISLNLVKANTIENMDIDVYIDKQGTAFVTENWYVDGTDGTEWYKGLKNLGKIKLTDFEVKMDNKLLKHKSWNVSESLSEKKGYYGINYTTDGLELCFGKYDYQSHKFTLTYTLKNFIFNTSDAQVIYFNFIDKLSNVKFNNFSIDITSYYKFPDTLDVWGYGHKGYAYVKNGTISMSNEGPMKNEYVVLLAKFPQNTFDTDISYSQFNTFDDVLSKAKKGTFEYNYDSNQIYETLAVIFNLFFLIIPFAIMLYFSVRKKYGYINNKTIDKKNTPMFRDIPCNKDIYYANALIQLNNPNCKKENILGAILLKWIKEGKITVKKEKNISLILGLEFPHDNENENKLYAQIYAASNDGILEDYELKKWATRNYDKFLKLFNKISNDEINNLKNKGLIRKRKDKNECKRVNVMEDKLYYDYRQLYGLKLFLDEFSTIKTKEAIEVHLWDEYLMFAYLFGIADEVAKQFKNMYPEIENYDNYIDFDTIFFLNDISISSVNAASSARSAAQSYSSGGGGFSRGGGGGGSFGGGGGGSR